MFLVEMGLEVAISSLIKKRKLWLYQVAFMNDPWMHPYWGQRACRQTPVFRISLSWLWRLLYEREGVHVKILCTCMTVFPVLASTSSLSSCLCVIVCAFAVTHAFCLLVVHAVYLSVCSHVWWECIFKTGPSGNVPQYIPEANVG